MAEGLSPDRVPQDDSEDEFDALLSALNHDLENLVKKSREQTQSLEEKLESLSQEVRIESARSESLTQKLCRKVGTQSRRTHNRCTCEKRFIEDDERSPR